MGGETERLRLVEVHATGRAAQREVTKVHRGGRGGGGAMCVGMRAWGGRRKWMAKGDGKSS